MKKVSILALSFVIASKGVFAAGFALNEYSTTSFGRAFAGQGISGDDYSSIVSNPAGMTLMNDGLQIGASLIDIYADIKDNSGVYDNERINIFSSVPSFFIQKSLSDKVTVGAAFYTPYGIGTDYKEGWWGRDEALFSEIIVYDFTLSGAYELSNKLSLGASVSTQVATAKLTNDSTVHPSLSHTFYSEIEGDNTDDLTFAYTLSAMYSVNENNRYGISYRSKSEYDLTGTHTMVANINIPAGALSSLGITAQIPQGHSMKGDAHTKVVLPENLMISSYHKIDDRLALSATLKWTRWSRFKELKIYSDIFGTDNAVSTTKEDWRDSWAFSVGADYDYSKNWIFRAGMEVEKTPIPNDDHRTARIPDDNRILAAVGASYKFNGGKLDLGYAHIFIDGGNAQYPSPAIFDANYALHINMVSAAVQYYF